MQNGFAPGPSGTIAVTDTSDNLGLPTTGNNVYVANVGDVECFIAFGGSDVEAVAAGDTTGILGSMSIPSGFTASLSMGSNTHIAAVTADGATTLRVTRGDGQ
ncbi:hypothetical protein [Rhizobium sp. BK251]|uniref:hypothetical protein n=1 Tax=Rhizobium sp. BK251 TaxID=2512125 RepID=UPI00104DD7F1|nr:hypothetical protein [Rhizobium sp. BK251]TCL70548.1 hypothetical protein EV286_107423 [Rhizobium sp. BK251]